jgi:hypothetical protein
MAVPVNKRSTVGEVQSEEQQKQEEEERRSSRPSTLADSLNSGKSGQGGPVEWMRHVIRRWAPSSSAHSPSPGNTLEPHRDHDEWTEEEVEAELESLWNALRTK